MWVGVLGPIEVTVDRPVNLASRRQRVLLAVLASHHGRVVSVDRLVEAIWEDDTEPQRGKAALQTVVSRLRTALVDAGGDARVIVSDEVGYRLIADRTHIDASAFEALIGDGAAYLAAGTADLAADALERGLGMFRGDPYGEFAHCDWARPEVGRLHERWADATELLAVALLDRGAHRELVPRLESAIAAHPYREGLQSVLMTALYRCGRQTDALQSYQAFRETLVEDLGLDPSPDLREHEARILRHDPALDAPVTGRPLRGYRLHEQTGTSELGMKWRATQPGIGREVCVTVIEPTAPINDGNGFDDLVYALGRLDHPNIAGLLDAWRDTTGAYLVTRVAHGSTLAEVSAAHAVTTSDAERLMRQVREAVDHAHGCGVAHGCLTSTHIVVDADGNAQVTGWSVPATSEAISGDDAAVATLATELGVRRPFPTGHRPNPYRGLAAFRESESAWFFGRERTVDAVMTLLADQAFVTLIGASGSGKSSVLLAGIAPVIGADGRGWEGWSTVSLTPNAHPCEALATAVDQCCLVAGRLPTCGVVVFLDQLEECFNEVEDSDGEELIAQLVELILYGPIPVKVVATLRADHLEEPLSHPLLGPVIASSLFPIGPMEPSELQRAIALPASAVGASVDADLIADLIADIGSRPHALPLMQFALTELFDRTGGQDLSVGEFRLMGGLEGAIARRAEAVHGSLDDVARSHVRPMFAKLAQTADDGLIVRRRVAIGDVLDGSDVGRVALDAFVAARLLTIEADPITREPLVSLSHEALAREWPRLAAWMEADRDAIADLRDLRGAIGPWLESARDPDRLLRGTPLVRASAAAAERPDLLSSTEREFLDASSQLAAASSRRARRATFVVALLATFALVGAVLAVLQRQEARASAESERVARTEADLGRLALQAQVLADGPTDMALLLAVESWRRDPRTASEAALLSALTAEPLVTRYIHPDSAAEGVIDSLLEDNAGHLVVRNGTSIVIRDINSLEPVGVSFTIGDDDTIAVRSDGRELASASADGRLRRWDLATGLPIPGDLSVPPGAAPPILAYTGEGDLVVADPTDGVVVVDTNSGASHHIQVGEPVSLIVADPLSASLVVSSFTATYSVSLSTGEVDVLAGLAGVRQMSFTDDGGRLLVVASQAEAGSLFEIDAASLRDHADDPSGFRTLRDAYIPLRYPSGVFELPGSQVIVSGALGSAVVLDPTWRSSSVIDLGTGKLVVRDDGSLVGTAERALTVIDLDSAGVIGRQVGAELVGAVSASADATRYAVQSGLGVEVVDIASGIRFPIDGSAATVAFPYLSPDGTIVALRSALQVEFVDVETNQLLGGPIVSIGAPPTFAPDGALVALTGLAGTLILSAPSFEVVAAVPPRGPGDLVIDFAWSPDGRHLALTSARGQTRVVNTSTGAAVGADLTFEPHSQLRWSADGSQIAVISPNDASRIVDATTGATLRWLPSVRGPIELAGWAAADQRLVLVRAAEPDDAVAEIIDVQSGQRIGPPIVVAELGSIVRGRGSVASQQLLVFPEGKSAVAITLNPAEWARIACEVAGRDLSRSEWMTYLGHIGPWRATCDGIS